MTETPLYSSRIIQTYLQYLSEHHPQINISNLLTKSGIHKVEISDSSHWLTQKQVDTFNAIVVETTGDPNISYEAGRFAASAKSQKKMSKIVLGFLSPKIAYLSLSRIYPKLSLSSDVKVSQKGRNSVEVIVTPKPGVKEKLYQCQNKIGMFEALCKLFTNRYANIQHSECIHRGAPHCRYVINWDNPISQQIKQFLRIFLMLALPSTVVLSLSLQIEWLLSIALGETTIAAILTILALWFENKELSTIIEKQGDLANDILMDAQKRHDNAKLIQEIGKTRSATLNINDITKSFIKVISNRLNYDRAIILLLDDDKKKISLSAQFGFAKEPAQFLENLSVDYDRIDKVKALQRTLLEKKPFYAKDFVEEEQSETYKAFLEQIATRAAIIVPIIYENKSLGLLAVDNAESEENFTETELSLLTGIASEIAASIAHAKMLNTSLENKVRYGTLVENMPIGLLSLDQQGVITNINPKAAVILGAHRDQLVGINIFDTPELKNANIDQLFKKCLRTRQSQSHQQSVNNLSGKNIELLYHMIPIQNTHDEINGVQALLEDITEFRDLEMQLRQIHKMESMGLLAGGIAHDFNNILSAIMGFADLASRSSAADSRTYSHISHIMRAAERARDLVKQILLFSRQSQVELKPIRIDAVIDEVLAFLRASLPSSVNIESKIESSATIMSDATQLHEIIMNIASNASHALSETGGIFSVQLNDLDVNHNMDNNSFNLAPGRYVHLSLSDNGCGIDKENLERIFDPFFTTKEKGKGTGMGLAVVHGIVTGQGGVIRVDSKKNIGTTFSLYWPIIESQKIISEEKTEPIQTGSETILFVDDEQMIADLATEMLTSLGYTVNTETQSEKALEFFIKNKSQIDLVITDMTMPEMTGDKLAERILCERADMPIILLTGYSKTMTPERAQHIGIKQFLYKPIKMAELAGVIREVFDAKSIEQTVHAA